MTNRAILTLSIVILVGRLALAQDVPPSKAAASPEAIQIAQAWALLAQGDSARAASLAANLLVEYPRNVSILALAIEAEVARTGAMAGLDTYERWLGTRKLDDGYALRRVARALLRDALQSHTAGPARLDALKALAADGDAAARSELEKAAFGGNAPEAGILASIGDARGVNIVIAQLNSTAGIKTRAIGALAESRSPLAVQALLPVLADPAPENRAAAADALGKLRATQAIPRIKPLLEDKNFTVHLLAAGALYRLGDMSGANFLQELQGSEHAGLRLSAAEATSSSPDPAWQNLVRGLTQDTQPEIRTRAAQLIAPYDPDLARATLERVLGDDNVAIRQLASTVYVQNVAGDFAVLRRFLRSADMQIRAQAGGRILELTR
jgi:HEAT repeat protein